MTQPNPESQTPPAKVLFPLGAACIIVPVLCMLFLDLGPVSSIMAIIVMVMGTGMVWQGTKNLKRDKV